MAIVKEERKLRIGVVGCGPIAQVGHFDAIRKARNATLYAICDVNEALLDKVRHIHNPVTAYSNYQAMLDDDTVDAVLVATSDYFHVQLAQEALAGGKPVFVEKPLGVTVEECVDLAAQVNKTGLVLQVGNNRRFDPGMRCAYDFIHEEMGEIWAVKAWYCDSAFRYTMTDNLFPPIIKIGTSKKPPFDEKSDKKRYFLMTHGSHLVDTARHLGGTIEAVEAKLVERSGAFSWFVHVEFAGGAHGHLDLTIPIQGDFEEGFRVYGDHGSVNGRAYLPWFHKSSEVECFSSRDTTYRRPLGADANTYKLQIESFADVVLNKARMVGASVWDGLATVQTMVAISRSAESGRPMAIREMEGAVQ